MQKYKFGLKAPPLDRIYRVNVDEYHRMMDIGVIEEGAPYELIDGMVVMKDRRSHLDALDEVGLTVEEQFFKLLIRITRDQYRLMIRAGILERGGPHKLEDGLIVTKKLKRKKKT